MEELPENYKGLENIRLVQKYLADEMGEEFELIHMLNKGIGVHNASLMDEVKELMEWLAEENCLKVLCATTTIAQGINFPVSSVCIQSISLSGPGYSTDMTPREFWNLAGRAGRIGQNSLGMVGIACNKDNREHITQFVSKKTGNLISRLVTMLDDIEKQGKLYELDEVIYYDQWTDFRCLLKPLPRTPYPNLLHRVFCFAQAGGIGEPQRDVPEQDGFLHDVAGSAGVLRDNGTFAPGQLIHERRFPDIGPPHDRRVYAFTDDPSRVKLREQGIQLLQNLRQTVRQHGRV